MWKARGFYVVEALGEDKWSDLYGENENAMVVADI